MRRFAVALSVFFVTLAWFGGCAYFNTLYNARLKYREAQGIKENADPERSGITGTEEQLYTEAFEKAAKVVKFYPKSRWVDDALFLMGMSAYEKGDYSTALRKFDEILTFFPQSNLAERALLMKAHTLIGTQEYAAALAVLERARSSLTEKKWRDDVAYLTGRVQYEQGEYEQAMLSFTKVVMEHKDSEWFTESGVLAGTIAEEWEQYATAVKFFDRVHEDGHTAKERFRGGIRKGECLLMEGQFSEARAVFEEAANRATNDRDEGKALLLKGRTIEESGDIAGAIEVYTGIVEAMPREEAAAEAQFAIGQIHDRAGDFETALQEYGKVKDQGTRHAAYRKAASRQNEIQVVIDLRETIKSQAARDVYRERYLLAEHLLERFEDYDGALAEYAGLADDAWGSEWGAKALYAQAWVFEHRLAQPDTASALMFRLANYYSGTEVDAAARRRFGFPIWKAEELESPRVHFIRPDNVGEAEEVVLERVAPRDVPLPPGVTEVVVWVRLTIGADGGVEHAKVVKSGGPEFDAAAVEAAEASKFLAPTEGGAAITVTEYRFPPVGAPAPTEAPTEEPPAVGAPVDSAAVPIPSPLPTLRGRSFDGVD